MHSLRFWIPLLVVTMCLRGAVGIITTEEFLLPLSEKRALTSTDIDLALAQHREGLYFKMIWISMQCDSEGHAPESVEFKNCSDTYLQPFIDQWKYSQEMANILKSFIEE